MFLAANEKMKCKALCITCHAVRWASSPLCVQGAPYPRQNHTSKTETILSTFLWNHSTKNKQLTSAKKATESQFYISISNRTTQYSAYYSKYNPLPAGDKFISEYCN